MSLNLKSVIFLIITILVLSSNSHAANSESPANNASQQILPTEKTSNTLEIQNKIDNKDLKGDINQLNKQMAELKSSIADEKKGIFDSTISALTFVITLIGGFATVLMLIIAIMTLFGWRSFKEMEENIKKSVQNGLDSDLQGIVDKTMSSTYSKDIKSLNEETERLQTEINDLKNILPDKNNRNAFDD